MLLGFLRLDMTWLDSGAEKFDYNQIGHMLPWLLRDTGYSCYLGEHRRNEWGPQVSTQHHCQLYIPNIPKWPGRGYWWYWLWCCGYVHEWLHPTSWMASVFPWDVLMLQLGSCDLGTGNLWDGHPMGFAIWPWHNMAQKLGLNHQNHWFYQ